MRLIPLLLVSVSLLLAGCAKEDDAPAGDDGTSTTTTPPTDAGNATTTTPPTGDAGGNDTAPMTPTPMELCAKEKDFTPPNQAPNPPANPVPVSSETCGTPGEGYRTITLNLTWSAATAIPATTPASPPVVKLLDSAGAPAGSCTGPTGQTVTGTCTVEATIVPGEYTLQYESAGNLKASIVVTVS